MSLTLSLKLLPSKAKVSWQTFVGLIKSLFSGNNKAQNWKSLMARLWIELTLSRKFVLMFAVGSILLSLTACGQQLVIQKEPPPLVLLEPTIVVETEPRTNGQLLELYLSTKKGLDHCNTDKESIRQFYSE